jgi:MFS family permease
LFKFELKSVQKSKNFLGNAKAVLSRPEVIFFFITVFIQGTASGLIYSFLLVYLEKDLGGSHLLLGLSIAATCSTEIIFFFFSDWIFRKVTVKGVIYMGIGTMAVRLVCYSFLTDPWWVFPMEFLHGITFAGMWSAGVQYGQEVAPPGLGATVQGMLSGVWGGLGVGVGSLVSGVLWKNLGPVLTFRVVAVWVFFGFLIFLASDLYLRRFHKSGIDSSKIETLSEGDIEANAGLLDDEKPQDKEEEPQKPPSKDNLKSFDGESSKLESLTIYRDDSGSSSEGIDPPSDH